MTLSFCKIVSQFSFVLILGVSHGQAPKVVNETFLLDSLNGLEMVYAKADVVNYHGRPAVHLVPSPDATRDYSTLATVSGTDFKDGAIEIEVAGSPPKDADSSDRGFIGLALCVGARLSR